MLTGTRISVQEYCPEARKFFARAPGLDALHRGAYDRYIRTLKTAGIWNKMDCVYLFATQNLQVTGTAATGKVALLNLKNTGQTCTMPGGTVTFTADRGFTGDGAATYLFSNYIPNSNGVAYTLNSAHIAARSLTVGGAAANNNRLVGVDSVVGTRVLLNTRGLADAVQSLINDAASIIGLTNTTTDGQFVLNRSGSAAKQLYRNTTVLGTDTTASAVLPTDTFTFLQDGGSQFCNFQIASGSFGGSLTANEIQILYDADTKYMTTVGAL